MKTISDPSIPAPSLPRVTTWEEWERGRAARRELSRRISSGRVLRRNRGNPRKDRLLRALNEGERGLPFKNYNLSQNCHSERSEESLAISGGRYPGEITRDV